MFSFGGGFNGDHMYPFYLIIRKQSKLCFNTFVNNFDSSSICYNPQLCYSFSSFILYFLSFSFSNFFYSYLVHDFFSLKYLNIQQKSQHVTMNSQLMAPFHLCVLQVNEICATSWFLESNSEDFGFPTST